ncbi:GNAT family N-acetyltransferase [Tepidibacter mesophilus]|uniref:GNAT family N-acetyltransferase n=1 Tax=Tepidibacter mesophilus TaxID=655607 RepID=UPI000C0818B1|nr:GNAT family N-acetyltransferase [Tepidibacter mesophilus]
MISICKMYEKNEIKIRSILDKENIDYEKIKQNILCAYENGELLGFAGYEIKENIAFLSTINIFDKSLDMVLKDGLIKALLNMADINGINIFIVKKCDEINFYKNIGFNNLNNEEVLFDVDENEYLYLKIADFFKNPCKNKKKD